MRSATYEKLVVGVDEELEARHAVAEGCHLARRFGAELELVHAVPVPPGLWPGVSPQVLEEMHGLALSAAKRRLTDALRESLPEDALAGADLDAALQVHAGHPAQVLLHRAQDLPADLMLLGPHVRRGTLDLGNTLRALLSKTEVPIWVQGEEPRPLRRVLVALDFSEESQLALDHAIALTAGSGASLRLLHAFQPPAMTFYNSADYWMPGPELHLEEHEEELRARLAPFEQRIWEAGLACSATVEKDEPTRSILRHADEVDLVVMGTHGRTGLSRFVLGSHALGVLARSSAHVLVVPRPGRRWRLGPRGAPGGGAVAELSDPQPKARTEGDPEGRTRVDVPRLEVEEHAE